MSNQQILQRARDLISTPEKWCKDTYGCKPNGEYVQDKHDVDESCTCLCTLGALIVAADHDDQLVKSAASALARGIPRNNPASSSIPHVAVQRYNDQATTSHEMILALFDRALSSNE